MRGSASLGLTAATLRYPGGKMGGYSTEQRWSGQTTVRTMYPDSIAGCTLQPNYGLQYLVPQSLSHGSVPHHQPTSPPQQVLSLHTHTNARCISHDWMHRSGLLITPLPMQCQRDWLQDGTQHSASLASCARSLLPILEPNCPIVTFIEKTIKRRSRKGSFIKAMSLISLAKR